MSRQRFAGPYRWVPLPVSEGRAERFCRELGLEPATARVLAARGLPDPDAVRRFLDPKLSEMHPPALLADLEKAATRLHQAVRSGQKILIYGDYDVDGVTSTVILLTAIELSGGAAEFHVPDRLRDGYGMRTEVVEQAAARQIALIVSVDTGIRADAVVRHAAALGIDVIVTDHHLPESALPPALAVVNPNRPDCPYPEKNLCGAAVAFKLASALLERCGWPATRLQAVLSSLLKLAAIATVADVVPLTGENRIIVRHGLAGLRDVRNPGLRALMETASLRPGVAPSAGDVGFRLGPRLNAAGRMAHAAAAIELFRTRDEGRARELAQSLDRWNAERQREEQQIVDAIVAQCEQTPVGEDQFAMVFSGAGWHPGVLGIVASRMVERYHRPAFVLTENAETGEASGSGRSIEGFHLLDALDQMPELFEKFGGHAHAAGVRMNSAKVFAFRSRFLEYAAARLTLEQLKPSLRIDGSVAAGEVNEKMVSELLALAPFGNGNPSPVLALNKTGSAAPLRVLKEVHLKGAFRCGERAVPFFAPHFASRMEEFPPGDSVTAAVTFQTDEYQLTRGLPGWSLLLRDFRVQ